MTCIAEVVPKLRSVVLRKEWNLVFTPGLKVSAVTTNPEEKNVENRLNDKSAKISESLDEIWINFL